MADDVVWTEQSLRLDADLEVRNWPTLASNRFGYLMRWSDSDRSRSTFIIIIVFGGICVRRAICRDWRLVEVNEFSRKEK